jgi:hypothetical protein
VIYVTDVHMTHSDVWQKRTASARLVHMAGITTISHRTSITTLYDQYFFTTAKLQTHPLTQTFTTEFAVLRPLIDAAQAEELTLMASRYLAEAAVQILDDALDAIVDGVDSTLRIELRNDRSSPIYLRYFGSLPPSEIKRPVLGGQLETMRSWPAALVESSNPILQQHGATLQTKLGEADAAAAEKQRVTQQLTDFRVLGTRARLIDRLNAARKSLYGKLAELQHANAALGSGWAESFFRGSGSAERLTLRELERRVAAAEVDLASLRTQRDELAAQEERAAQARAAAELAEKQARLDAARAAAAELAAEIADLETDLGDANPTPARR